MIRGLGNDIIEISRIERLYKRFPERFLKTLFTPSEQAYCLKKKEPWVHFAGRFAAKEAIVKALGTGFTKEVTWLDIEVSHDSFGKPCVIFSESLRKLFQDPVVLISISHCKTFATAVAVWS